MKHIFLERFMRIFFFETAVGVVALILACKQFIHRQEYVKQRLTSNNDIAMKKRKRVKIAPHSMQPLLIIKTNSTVAFVLSRPMDQTPTQGV